MKDWSSIYSYKIAHKKYERDKKRYTSSFKIIQNMLHQVNEDPINALVYQITEKHLHSDVYNNIMQYLDTGVPVLRKIRFDNSNIASTPYRNNIEDTIEILITQRNVVEE